jgi:hypothetical protein
LQLGPKAVVGDLLHAAVGVVNEHDLARPEQSLRNRERADHVVGDDAACVSQDVCVSVLEAEGGEDVQA